LAGKRRAREQCPYKNVNASNEMKAEKKKTTAKTRGKFKDLTPKKDPKGGPIYVKPASFKGEMLNPQPLPP
jgi:hypothetical protein